MKRNGHQYLSKTKYQFSEITSKEDVKKMRSITVMLNESMKNSNVEYVAAKKRLHRKKCYLLSDQILVKTIDRLVECLFIEDSLEQAEMVLTYLHVVEEYYEKLYKTSDDKDVNGEYYIDFWEIVERMTNVVVDMRKVNI